MVTSLVVALVWSVGWVVAAAAGAEAEVTDLGIARWVEEGKDACRTGGG
jgi:hypothetical protein